ncbi:MAG: S-layer homology domain-containing protein [Firmicutes bacterium]|nr:S-layer homology domain-containing protein [Bacillota bacterium]
MKKQISIILSFVMLVTSMLCNTAFAAFSDVDSDNTYKEAITTLSNLGIINGYEDGTFQPEGEITRAEFAKIVICTLSYENLEPAETTFTDVSGHWAQQYIDLCADLSIINGMGDGTFAPDSQVTLEQALKMVVCTLGYGTAAEANGGWPTGYQTTATNIGLMDKVSNAQYSANATRGVIAQIVYNALEISMTDTDSMGNVSIGTKTLLNDYLKVKKLKGTLVGVSSYVTKDCSVSLGTTEMNVMDSSGEEYVIDYSSYTDDVTQINTYLGKTITVYYRQVREIDDRVLILIDDESTNNNVTEVSSYDISEFSGNQLKYYTDSTSNKTKSLKLNFDDISVRYNGKLVTGNSITLTNGSLSTTVDSVQDAVTQWFNPDGDYFIYGTVTLTDNSADGDINLVEIMDYETMVAYKVPTTSDYRIQDKLKTANYLILDPNSAQYEYTISKDGSQIEVTDIKANDVILYAASLDGELYTVYVTSKSVTGKVTSLDTESMTLELDGVEYNYSETLPTYITNNENKTLKASVSGTFYTDMLGTIVFGTLTEDEEIPYGYIVNAGIEESTDEGYIIAYVPSSNASTAVPYTMASKVKVNGVSMKPEAVINALSAAAGNSNGDADEDMAEAIYGSGKTPTLNELSQIAKIKIESSKVTEIITLADAETDDDGNTVTNVSNEDASKMVKYRDLQKYYYTSSSFKESSSSSTYFTTNSSTVVLCVPMNRKDTSDYAKKTVSSAFTSGESYYVQSFDVDKSKFGGLHVRYGSDSTLTNVTKTTDFSVVASAVKETYDEDNDETRLQVSVYRGAVSTPTAWTTYDMSEFADVVPGDVIQFAYDSDNYIQGRINNIKFSDIADVIDTSDDAVDDNDDSAAVYDWTTEQDPTEDNNYQSYLFDYRFKQSGTTQDETYTSSSLGTIPYSRAFMANVSQVLTDSSKIYVTKSGFTMDSSGEWVLDDSDYEEISIGSAKIIRMESDRKSFSPYVEDTTTALTYTDLKDAKNYGTDCSKVLICTRAGSVKLIVIYD